MTHGRLDATPHATLPRVDRRAVEWRVAGGRVGYAEAVAAMEARVEAIARGAADEFVWLVEHPPLYTAGTSAGEAGRAALPFPLHATGRGGQVTYHGPGQRVAYVMLDLRRRGADPRGPDVRAFVAALECWIIDTLAAFAVAGERREDRVGVWVRRPDKGPTAEDKIAAIGIRVRRGVTFHGLSLNVDPELAHYAAITPCGIAAGHFGVTSLAALGRPAPMAAVDAALADAFAPIFGPRAP